MPRLFIAINFMPEICQQLAAYAHEIQAASTKARPIRAENIHLTLAFLGEQPDAIKAQKALTRVCSAPLKLYSGNLGHFTRAGGDIYWLGIRDNPELIALQASLIHELAKEGFLLERRPFRPHLTLAREVHACHEAKLPAPPRFIQHLKSIELMESARIDGKLTYTPLFSQTFVDI